MREQAEGMLREDEDCATVPVVTTSPMLNVANLSFQRVAYVYKAKREINGSRVRVIWGRISRSHGNSGAVKSKFRTNLPAKTFGASCRIVSRHF